jgi:hypothetical protein
LDANFYLGRITSRWHYVADQAFIEANLVNVCNCDWQGPFTLDDVPGSLLQCRGPFRRIRDEKISEYTKLLHSEATGRVYRNAESSSSTNLFRWLSDSVCEDLVALYLQHEKGYAVIPSTSKHSLIKYEFALIHRETGQEATVQVKNGGATLHCPDYATAKSKVYLFTSEGKYSGTRPQSVEIVEKPTLLRFAQEHRQTLPKTIRRWVNYLYP